MNYQETLDFLYAQLPMFSRIGASAIKKDLTNTLALCAASGDPQHKFKSIHIAGTNGKGSTSHTLAAIFQANGYKTGLYTSPHLKDFRERIKVNGMMCSEDFVVDYVQDHQADIEHIRPSFFEMTVAMAFSYFAQEKVDIAIIETGLGGRLDSTNVVTPELSIITNIGWDHMDILGNTLGAIAGEKAGIIKKECPVVIGEWIPETKDIFIQTAAQRNAPIYFAQDKYTVTNARWDSTYMYLDIADKISEKVNHYTLDLPGIYQEQNIITTLTAVDILQKIGWAFSQNKIHEGISNVKSLTGLHGRWELVHHAPRVILDVGHNKSCMEQIQRQLDVTEYERLFIICGFVKDKDIHAALDLLPANASYLFTQSHIPRALPVNELHDMARTWGFNGTTFDNVNDAIQNALAQAQPQDLILVCGSVFLVAEVDTDLLS